VLNRLVEKGVFVRWSRQPVTEFDSYHQEHRVPGYEITLPDGYTPYILRMSHFSALLKLDPQELPRYIASRDTASSTRKSFPDMFTVPFAMELLSRD
jgi:hypothetical protein